MTATRTLLVLLAVAFLAGCSPKKIPGTEIDDTDDTRTILSVMEQYRKAMEAKNVQELVSLFDPTFQDDGGSAAPDDDLDYKSLPTALPARLSQFEDIKLELAVRKIAIDKELSTAAATYTWTTSYKMPGLAKKTQSDTDIKQMTFRLADKDKHLWKITSGI